MPASIKDLLGLRAKNPSFSIAFLMSAACFLVIRCMVWAPLLVLLSVTIVQGLWSCVNGWDRVVCRFLRSALKSLGFFRPDLQI